MRIVQKEVGRIRYFADLVISGYPPSKNRKLGKGDVGLDIGTSTLAVSSLAKTALFNLAEQVQEISRDIRLVNAKWTVSRRATNPQISIEMARSNKARKPGYFPIVIGNIV
ncbi:hypothetical protein [Lentibacillus sp. CBA3610]|uniref:hypothetical protein n=1 Tax=Lentibacillus sp. CBA3610 TaxID=2518176 RepID=UPI0015950B53|nr:hypothetical protein [Lentibacillus sp. CBA3610]QKY68279.1 hypothetical protein Len3610_00330 [Lentibacillus sp. CBA3610]